MTSSSRVNRAWWASVGLFLIHGLVVSTWVARIPSVQIALHLPNGILGLTLLSAAVGAVCAIPITGWLIVRFRSKRLSIATTLAFCAGVTLMGFAVNALTLACALFFFGAAAASMDVAMNAQGVDVEKELGSPTMSRFHGMFSLGGMVGAGIGGVIASHGIPASFHFLGAAAICALLGILCAPFLLEEEPTAVAAPAHRLPLRRVPAVLFALSAIGFCILLSEGAIADWTAVYLRQVLHAGPGQAAAGYAVFSAAMATFRFLGDWITARLGPVRTVRTGSLLAAAGLCWALLVPSALWSLPGFAATGAGFSVIIPLVFGSGGRVESVEPGAGIATVTGLGYIGFIAGPPSIGFLSQLVTLRYALGLVVCCCLASAAMSGSLARLGHKRAPVAIPEGL